MDKDTVERLQRKMNEYLGLMHAVQSGVAMEHQMDPSDGSPKHLRVGINSALVSNSALVELLVSKGVFTDEEYLDALIKKTREEKENYEQRLTALTGGKTKVTLY